MAFTLTEAGVFLKAAFQAAADKAKLTPVDAPARLLHGAFLPVGMACAAYKKKTGAAEFYGRLNRALLDLGWPADEKNAAQLKHELASFIREFSISLDHPQKSTLDIRKMLVGNQHLSRYCKVEADYVLAHLFDVSKALRAVTQELDREIASPKGVQFRYSKKP